MNRRYIPPRPTGSDREARFDQAVWDSVFGPQSHFIDSSTVTVNQGPRGVSFNASPGGSGGATIRLCMVTQLYFEATPNPDVGIDYIGVTAWNVSSQTLSGGQFNVAKCYSARMYPAETVDGTVITYLYDAARSDGGRDDNTRLANFPTYGNERQVVHDRYLVYDPTADPGNQPPQQSMIWVTTIQGGTDVIVSGSYLQYGEIAPQKYWARSNDQTNLP